MKKLYNWWSSINYLLRNTDDKIKFFVLIAIFFGLILGRIDNNLPPEDNKSFWENILVELHGMFFDTILFGILLTIYENFVEKKNTINRLHEEIDDYRGWKEPEAMYRIVGCIKRLNKLGVSKITLTNCYLTEANLREANLRGADLREVILIDADLRGANLVKADLRGADLREADLTEADLREADLAEVKLGSIEQIDEINRILNYYNQAEIKTQKIYDKFLDEIYYEIE